MEPPTEPRVSFDGQASAYEDRAGLPDAVCREVVAQLLADVVAPPTVVDVGAGTGTLGRHLLAAGVRYIGLDVSRPMLAEFSRRVADRSRGLLLQADADGAWPLGNQVADVILFSRSAHLLKREGTLAEVLRIAAPGCRVFVGRVRRPRDCAAEQLRRAMQQRLRELDLPGRNGERAKRDFLEALERHGARKLTDRTSSAWSEREAPLDSIRSWRSKAGLGGRLIADELKEQILDDVERWARDTLGDVATEREQPRHYELEGVQLA